MAPRTPSRTPRRKSTPTQGFNIFLQPPPTSAIPDYALGGPRHWLHSRQDRATILYPFGDDNEDTEQDPKLAPSVIDNRPGRFRHIYEPEDAHNDQIGTIVIPRHHNNADLLVLLATVNPEHGSHPALMARFLVSSHAMKEHIPSFNEQFTYLAGLTEAQRLGNRASDIYATVRWTLPPVDLDAAWIVLTIVHGRWPLAWDILDIPHTTLFNIARFVDAARITPNSETWRMIRSRLEYTLARQRKEISRPTHPCVGQWVYIAKIFHWQDDFTSLWANLVVSTYRYSMASVQVDRYSEGFGGDPRPTASGRWWYTINDLGPDLKRQLRDHRQALIIKLTELWFAFQRTYRTPPPPERITESTTYAGSPQDLRRIIIDYSRLVEKKLQKEALLANRQIDARTAAGCAKLVKDVNAVFANVQSIDVYGSTVNIPESKYWRQVRYEHQDIETPVELDPVHGSYKSIHTFQSGAGNSLIYWRNRKSWRENELSLQREDRFKRAYTFIGCTVALMVFFEYLIWHEELLPQKADNFRALMYGLWLLCSVFNVAEAAQNFLGKVVRHTMHGRYWSY
ncbi:hypothetical protein ABW21_db0208341 [Orbilia brochopaga]|nr:hypothetical protein ABW21_db0208341 [Drechslerella brochopaga]